MACPVFHNASGPFRPLCRPLTAAFGLVCDRALYQSIPRIPVSDLLSLPVLPVHLVSFTLCGGGNAGSLGYLAITHQTDRCEGAGAVPGANARKRTHRRRPARYIAARLSGRFAPRTRRFRPLSGGFAG